MKRASKLCFSSIEVSPFLESAAKTLRTCSESEEIVIQGRIIQLQADNPLTDDDTEESDSLSNEDSRLILVNWENEKGKFALLRIPLTLSQYRLACDAHRDEKNISIRGIPEKKKKFLYLTSPKDFKVL